MALVQTTAKGTPARKKLESVVSAAAPGLGSASADASEPLRFAPPPPTGDEDDQQKSKGRGKGGKGAKGGKKVDKRNQADALIDQLERRLATLEHFNFDQLRGSAELPPLAAGMAAGVKWNQEIQEGTPAGLPHIPIMISTIDALCDVLEQNLQEMTKQSKQVFLICLDLQTILSTQTEEDIDLWARYFRIDRLRKQGEKQQEARLSFSLFGEAGVATDLSVIDLAISEQLKYKGDDISKRVVSTICIDLGGDLQPLPSPSKVRIQAVVRRAVSLIGMSRFTGRAPRSGLAWKHHQS